MFLSRSSIITTMVNVNRSIIVDNALIWCYSNFTMENTFKGNVVLLGPETKKLIITSSRDSVKARSPHETIPGAITGSVTTKNVCIGDAPRSMAASSRFLSKPWSLALTTMAT